MHRVAVMQPYFLPYLGYWQLLAAVDTFVVYDNLEYTKKGWINRNRMLVDGAPATFTLPVKAASDFAHIVEREIADDFKPGKLTAKFAGVYRAAPHWRQLESVLERILACPSKNLFEFLAHQLRVIAAELQLDADIVTSSTVPIDHSLRAQDKVLAFCTTLAADVYVNAPGGRALYSPDAFAAIGCELRFVDSHPVAYEQFDRPFVPGLSIADVLAFNPVEQIREWVHEGFDLLP